MHTLLMCHGHSKPTQCTLFEFPWECSTGHMPNYYQIHLRYSHPHELQLPCRARVTSGPYTAKTILLIMHNRPAKTKHTSREEGERHSPAAKISYSDTPELHATTFAHLARVIKTECTINLQVTCMPSSQIVRPICRRIRPIQFY